jgi:hypothetical protein
MVRSAIVRCVRQEACNVVVAKRSKLDLARQDQTERCLFTIPDPIHGGR